MLGFRGLLKLVENPILTLDKSRELMRSSTAMLVNGFVKETKAMIVFLTIEQNQVLSFTTFQN